MRYYECLINANTAKIEKNAKIRWKDYDYDSPICAVNKYIYRNLKSNVQFIIYREEEHSARALFSFSEDKITYKEAYTSILNILEEVAGIHMAESDPEETTLFQFIDGLLEARRRGIMSGSFNYLNETNDFIYQATVDCDKFGRYGFLLEEQMVSMDKQMVPCMYDQSMIGEIEKISQQKKALQGEMRQKRMRSMKSILSADRGTARKAVLLAGNMVHYIISSRSLDSALDMAAVLLKNLAEANRISSRRIEIVREIDVHMYKKNDVLERLIQGNRGGAIVIDMTEKLGENPLEYSLNCKYIENLVKRYKNDCLFIFTYNMNHPGFAYTLLPMIQKHVSLVKIKEATGSREDAVSYLQNLIEGSQYVEYANQASEFFESYRGNKFSQTDVIEAYEKFEPWCMNRNFGGGYNYNSDDDFMLERDEELSASEQLEKMIGLESVKTQINKIIVTSALERERKLQFEENYPSNSMHMIFGGNPGSAKTTVAKLFAGIAKEHGILKSGAFVVSGGMDYNDLMGPWRIKQDFASAKGGALFIDEAYALSYGDSIAALIQEMENRRDEVIVILAGYNNKMEQFLTQNDGLKSRIPYWVDFPDYNTEELVQIFHHIADERGFHSAEKLDNALSIVFDKACCLENFGNGRYVRNLFEKAVQNQSVRLLNVYGEIVNVPQDELFLLTDADILASEEAVAIAKAPGEAQQELDEMIGLATVKKIIHKAVATFKMRRLLMDKGIRKDKPVMHMVFTGNPGTAKTTTARLVAEIMRDEKILASGKFVEVGRADLVGHHVGETAKVVKQRFREARGGVLFIDEAYSLCDYNKNSFGDEAINTIVQEMENHREDTVVIFAGYPNEMKEFLNRNPGMASRIAFHVEFDDYSTDELCAIAKIMLKKKGLKITDEAMDKLKSTCEVAKKSSDYGNGRYVRKMLEEAEMNLAERISDLDASEIGMDLLTTIEACDIEETEVEKETRVKIGFRAS